MNTSEESHVKTRNRRERRARERELSDVKAVMSTVEGRRFVWSILAKSGISKTSFTGNSWTYFNEGMRNLGLIVQSDVLEACPEAYLVAMQEAKTYQKREDDAETALLSTPEKEDENG